MRLFVALEPPPAWGEAASELQSALPPQILRVLRLVDPRLMHLTLRFVGETPDEVATALDAALEGQVRAPGVRLVLGRAETFGPPARTQVVYVGIGGDLVGLSALVEAVEQAVVAAGLPREQRRFTPHLTLARVQRRATADERRAAAQAVVELDAPRALEFVAREVVLVRSILGRNGPRYEVLGRYGSAARDARL